MRKNPFVLLFLLPLISPSLQGHTQEKSIAVHHEANHPFEAFTGKITRNKVRLRLQPSLEGAVIKEMARDEMLIITGEHDDFYTVQPPKGTKAYVYRAFVLDGNVEADRVNVRLEPSVEAPVMVQLNTGDKIQGKVCSANNKWLEITPPAATRFYISKDYIEKIGDSTMIARIEERRHEVEGLINDSLALAQVELDRSFGEIQLEKAYEGFARVIDEFHDFPEFIAKAKESVAEIQEKYMQKKIKYLEDKAIAFAVKSVPHNKSLESDVEFPEEMDEEIEYASSASTTTSRNEQETRNPLALQGSMASWLGTEKKIYEEWAKNNPGTLEMFYHDQSKNAITLRGVIQPYDRIIKNKPGDFVLLSQATRQPIAYLYSTKVNLKNWDGHVVSIKVSPRDNHNFAFPAYFVLDAE